MLSQKKIFLNSQAQKIIGECAVACYPQECCGFILGNHVSTRSAIFLAMPVPNEVAANNHSRYVITPQNYLDAERLAEQTHMNLLGVYHSHPDQVAAPSVLDAQCAIPNFLYLIISVSRKGVDDLRCWRLNDGLNFKEQQLEFEYK